MTREDGKIRAARGKVALELIPLRVLTGMARVFGYGAKKYERGNWHLADDGNAIGRYIGAILRHLGEVQRPDGTYDLEQLMVVDAESGLPHIDHALCSLVMLRGIAIKLGAPADPGEGNEPPRFWPVPGECDDGSCGDCQNCLWLRAHRPTFGGQTR
jgi:hypothetical protein